MEECDWVANSVVPYQLHIDCRLIAYCLHIDWLRLVWSHIECILICILIAYQKHMGCILIGCEWCDSAGWADHWVVATGRALDALFRVTRRNCAHLQTWYLLSSGKSVGRLAQSSVAIVLTDGNCF